MSLDHGRHCAYDDNCHEMAELGDEFCWWHIQLVETPDPDEYRDHRIDDELGVA